MENQTGLAISRAYDTKNIPAPATQGLLLPVRTNLSRANSSVLCFDMYAYNPIFVRFLTEKYALIVDFKVLYLSHLANGNKSQSTAHLHVLPYWKFLDYERHFIVDPLVALILHTIVLSVRNNFY